MVLEEECCFYLSEIKLMVYNVKTLKALGKDLLAQYQPQDLS